MRDVRGPAGVLDGTRPGSRPKLVVLAVLAGLVLASAACGVPRSTGAPPAGSTTGLPPGSLVSAPPTSATEPTTIPAPTTTTTTLSPTLEVGLTVVNWFDPYGTLENYQTGAITQGRPERVEIRYPTRLGHPGAAETSWAPPSRGRTPYPVIVFAEGYNVAPDVYAPMLDTWVRAGFVVVSPVFPDTSRAAVAAQHGTQTEADEFNQPADVAFVVDQIVAAANGEPISGVGFLKGLINPSALALAGQSDGADTIAALLYNQVYSANLESLAVQPRAVALLSGAEWTRPQDYYAAGTDGPAALVVQSAADACNVPSDSAQLYNLVDSAKWYQALDTAPHLAPYVGLGNAAPVVDAVTTDFFRLELEPGTTSAASLQSAGDVKGVSQVTTAAGVIAPAPPSVPNGQDPCSLAYSLRPPA